MKFVDPKTDIAFKKIFGNDAHKSILIEFLNEILELDYPIESVEILNSYQPPKFAGLKTTGLDVKAKDSSEREFIVEMQVAKEAWFSQRAMYYTSKAYSQQLPIGQNYYKLKPVIFLGILNFDAFEKNTQYFSRHLIINRETHQHDLHDLEWNFIELKKFKKTESDLDTVADKWIYFIQQAIDLDHVPEHANTAALKLAYEIAEQHQWSAEELAVYDAQEMEIHRAQNVIATARMDGLEQGIQEGIQQGIQQGIQEGIQQGIQEGIQQGIQEGIQQGIQEGIQQGNLEGKLEEKRLIAKNLLTTSLDIDMIAKVTNLTHAEIENLRKIE
ncbi:MAG: Rpn family recombination-promoting nuclease/putative transposase [Methylovulum sp.]|nr:Rpn family recombination-promoting nuclease/putative transposase [Methylovulum sp.]